MSLTLFLRSFRHRRDWRGNAVRRTGYAIRYTLRSALVASLHAAWLVQVDGTPALAELAAADPRLLARPQHPYISRRLSLAQRYAIVAAHYRHVLATFPPTLFRQVYLDAGLRVGTLQLKDATELAVELCRPAGQGREGELCLRLVDEAGRVLSSVVFSIADNGRTLLLGCLQGACAELGRDAVRELTKQSYGLRPKNLLLSMLLAWAGWVGATRVRGVANVAHPFAGRGDKIKADYDRFWLDCQGVLSNDGFFDLPAREPLRSEAEVESKHRSAFRKREALRAQACALLLAALDHAHQLARAA